MASIETKSMDRPDERRTPEKTELSVVHLGDATVARLSAEPGWTWASCIKPIAGTESCQAAHLGYVVSGTIHITADDGAESDLKAGDTYRLEPGHHAEVVGDQPFVALEFESKTAETYTKGWAGGRGFAVARPQPWPTEPHPFQAGSDHDRGSRKGAGHLRRCARSRDRAPRVLGRP